jgi:hypothetical protein
VLGNLGLFGTCNLHILRGFSLSWFESMPGSQPFNSIV